MQAVILAAGKSTRTYPLTLTKPKPLLKVANKTLLEHNLDCLNNIIDEAIIIVGYKKDLIKKCIGIRHKNIKIRYAEQKKQLGTGNALSIAEKHVKNEFISLHGDDIYSEEDFRSIAKTKYSILVKKAENPSQFGAIIKKNDILLDIIEKPEKPVSTISNLVNTGLYKLDKKIFHIIRRLKKSKRNEYELTDAVKMLSKNHDVRCISSKNWLPIGYPWDLLNADISLRKNKNVIGKNSKIEGNIINSSIGDSCRIYGNVKNSIIMGNTFIGKGSVIEDSVIGKNVYFNGKALAGNNVHSAVKGEWIMVDRLGAIIGDNVKADNVMIKPGCKIWPNKSILNKYIKEDVK